ncbi:hypothetical protein LJC56_07305 [Christensenellaceae bacterium OttesenSCG-928-K19]|nr:hypothetical protein [Christensenellaceae bacterium OttesenSCG-928-K19]
MTEYVKMQFPADTEYISAIRLAVSGVAGKKDYNVDEIEDLKSCVSEACLLVLCGQECSGLSVDIAIEDSLKLKVEGLDAKPLACEECEDFNEEISKLMIEALSENVEFKEVDGILYTVSFEK